MDNSKVCNIVFAGGSCGMTMIRAGEKLIDLCSSENLVIKIRYVDLWVSDYLMPNTDMVIEMFPYYKNLAIPIVNGRPFLSHTEENELYLEIIKIVKDIQSQKKP